MLENYLKYLKIIDSKLEKFFEIQKPYIFCKVGCSQCCKNAQFPYSEIEIEYLMQGAMELDDKTRKLIHSNIEKILKEKKNFKGDIFKYDCPFLINDACSVYKNRGIVCRAFGLLSIGENNKIKIPFCHHQNGNYSNVIEKGTSEITQESYKKSGIEQEPKAYNVSYKFLTKPEFEDGFNFKFGEKKALIDWFELPEES